MDVVIWGMGKLGRTLVEISSDTPRVTFVGAITARAADVRRDFPGIRVFANLDQVQSDFPEAVVLHTGHVLGGDLVATMAECARRGLDVITSAGLFHPEAYGAPSTAELDSCARTYGSRVLSAGAHPGFVLDLLPALLLDLAPGWARATVTKPSDARSWPRSSRHMQGIGRPPHELEQEVPYPLSASAHLLASAVGRAVVKIRESRKAEVASTAIEVDDETVVAGLASGFRQECQIDLEGGRRVTLLWSPTIRVTDGADLSLRVEVEGPSWLSMRLDGGFRQDPYPATAFRMLHVAAAAQHMPFGVHGVTDVSARWC
ncbi:hypothetical protein A5630_15565 [Mycolicibacterium mucogenicum]|uniref:Dihydrodipicolinate reductase n=1 Tax=Mycolicibacterium mucogenicum TaxID=56689 RepID=A0A1A3H960_MYCMU|nr:hypothetical protein [Mycolicibacterium mucogenicum]OBJ44822.1 hypothetical protein A5630_15565 [Mycolicibacterium mucogenicum]